MSKNFAPLKYSIAAVINTAINPVAFAVKREENNTGFL